MSYFSYSIPLEKTCTTRHRQGINALYISQHSYHNSGYSLFSGGRDGVLGMHSITTNSNTENSINHKTFAISESHTHWINAICSVLDGRYIVTASSDSSVQLHDASVDSDFRYSINPVEVLGFSFNASIGHSDYVKSLSASESQSFFVSGGLDKRILLWDTSRLKTYLNLRLDENTDESSIVEYAPSKTFKESVHSSSVYALDCALDGSFIVSGSPDKVIRLYDPRTGRLIASLKEHSDTIRALVVSADNQTILSASSDGTVKLWSVSSKKCINTLNDYRSPIWSIATSDRSLSSFYVAGKSGDIARFSQDSTPKYTCEFICKESSGVHDLKLDKFGNLWSATNSSTLNLWNISQSFSDDVMEQEILCGLNDMNFSSLEVPLSKKEYLLKQPSFVISGGNSISKFSVMDNKRFVLTEDSYGDVCLWDIIKGLIIETYGQKSFDKMKTKISNSVELCPSWCNVDILLGLLTVTIESPKCFDGEIYRDEMGLSCLPEDPRINLGRLVVDSIFGPWSAKAKITGLPDIQALTESVPTSPSNLSLPRNTVIQKMSSTVNVAETKTLTVSVNTSSTITILQRQEQSCQDLALYRFFQREVETIDPYSNSWCPEWIYNCCIRETFPQRDVVKIAFQLQPYPDCELTILPDGQNKLLSNRMIRLKKLLAYIVDKTGMGSSDIKPDDWLELSFKDFALPYNMYLGTAKQRFAPSSDLILYYRPRMWNRDVGPPPSS